uniref:Uncharacterized protein n=1 Tax=Panagrolaimus davidi TaxID=227884 RepID=A0A914PY61_9BILA
MQSVTTLTNLSPFANKPCLLLTFPTCKILFDCAIDLHPMNFYSPCSVITKPDLDITDYPNENAFKKDSTAKRLRRKHSTDEKDPFLDVLPDETFIDAIPEVNFLFFSNIDLSQIDAIFISNWESLKALPFLVENSKLYCPIYSSEPVVSLGGMIVEEMIHFLERVDKNIDDKKWVNIQKWNESIGEDPKKSFPYKWKNLYKTEAFEKALSRITRVAINQPIVSLSNFFSIFI